MKQENCMKYSNKGIHEIPSDGDSELHTLLNGNMKKNRDFEGGKKGKFPGKQMFIPRSLLEKQSKQ